MKKSSEHESEGRKRKKQNHIKKSFKGSKNNHKTTGKKAKEAVFKEQSLCPKFTSLKVKLRERERVEKSWERMKESGNIRMLLLLNESQKGEQSLN